MPQLEVFKSLLRIQTYALMISYALIGVLFGAVERDITFTHLMATSNLKLLGVIVMIAFWYVNGTALNDYADYEIDKINLKGDKQRPLVAGLVTRSGLLKYALVCGAVALGISFWISLYHGILMCLLLFFNWAYSLPPFQISRRGGLAPMLLPIGYIILPVLSSYWTLQNKLPSGIVLVCLGLYIHFLSRIILKDYRDVKGDKQNGKITFLLKHGNKKITQVSMFCLIVSTIILCVVNYRYLGRITLFIALFLGIALKCLYELSKTDKWSMQKIWITFYGRMCSGLITLLLIALMCKSQFVAVYKTEMVAALITIVFIWSTDSIRKHLA